MVEDVDVVAVEAEDEVAAEDTMKDMTRHTAATAVDNTSLDIVRQRTNTVATVGSKDIF